jgi:hypothetical protein
MSDPSQIIPDLYIGNSKTAERLGDTFDLVVNCTPTLPFHPNCKLGIRIPVDDDPFDSYVLYQILRDTNVLQKMHDMLQNQQKVLVHCLAGAQRSPTVVACYLIKYNNFDPNTAIEYIKSKRKIAFFWGANLMKTMVLMHDYVECKSIKTLGKKSWKEICLEHFSSTK